MKPQQACAPGVTHLPPDAWFPSGQTLSEETALAIMACNRCPVRKQCAQMVIDSLTKPYPIKIGIYAGVRLTDTHNQTTGRARIVKEKYDKLREIAGFPAKHEVVKALR